VEAVEAKWKNLSDTFANSWKDIENSLRRWWKADSALPWDLAHFVVLLFIRSVITRPTEGNIEDPEFCNIFIAAANEYDFADAQFKEEFDVYGSESESSQPFQLNASPTQPVSAS
jgi:hypothetical protein